jgi:hypothetical protein
MTYIQGQQVTEKLNSAQQVLQDSYVALESRSFVQSVECSREVSRLLIQALLLTTDNPNINEGILETNFNYYFMQTGIFDEYLLRVFTESENYTGSGNGWRELREDINDNEKTIHRGKITDSLLNLRLGSALEQVFHGDSGDEAYIEESYKIAESFYCGVYYAYDQTYNYLLSNNYL